MRAESNRIAWLPPLLVGAAGAIAAEVAVAILLYAGPGLMRSLTTVLAVEGAALGAGLYRGPIPSSAGVDRVRRRWVFCLASYVAAAVFGTSWSMLRDLGGGPVGQGLGLAVLAALPLYSCGLVLGGMGPPFTLESEEPHGGPGAPAAVGAGLGVVITGIMLPRAPLPGSLLVACLVLLSGAGMAYGAVLSDRPVVHVRARRRSSGQDVRVEDRVRVSRDETARYLLEGGHVRRRQALNGTASVPWDVVVARSILQASDGPKRVLVLGGGASALPHAIVDENSAVSVDVLERSAAVADMARDHFGTGLPAGTGGVSLKIGNLEDLLTEVRGPYDLVIVDTGALAPLGGVAGLSRSAWEALLSAVSTGGALAWGPRPLESGVAEPAREWCHAELRRVEGDDQEALVVSRSERVGRWVGPIGDFLPLDGGSSEQ